MTAASSPRLCLALRRAALGAVLAASGSWAAAQQAQATDADAPVVYERVVSGGAGAAPSASPAPGAEAAGATETVNAPAAGAAAQAAGARAAVRISHQDAGSRVDELRVRGQTQEITVTPAGQLPSYEVQPGNSQRYQSHQSGRHSSDGTNGPRRWKLGEF
ncbi:hypothetical protein [Vandammella animalimorsus]|uniref:hypothetical protein n=1 Tax=Vandammella animalimorsus TaxID=2029117 RepID=UPI00117750DB|nr:hypothetical protein [Vandammella animalimorsus]